MGKVISSISCLHTHTRVTHVNIIASAQPHEIYLKMSVYVCDKEINVFIEGFWGGEDRIYWTAVGASLQKRIFFGGMF